MRIVSRFHDYYDIGLNLGYDSHVDFIRTKREVELTEDKALREVFKGIIPLARNWTSGICLEYVVIGFCGAFYPLVIANKFGKDPLYCYSLEELAQVIEITRWGKYKEFYETVKSLKSDELFIANQAPIVIVELTGAQSKATWNGFLKPYNFVRIIDPFQAFQRIEMFLGNMAAPEKPIPARTDVEKLQSHGFDKKISFRKGKKS